MQPLLKEYEAFVEEHRHYPGGFTYTALALAGEAGEVANAHKKELRDGVDNRTDLLFELGDVLWYLQACAKELDSSLSQVMMMNMDKLTRRYERSKMTMISQSTADQYIEASKKVI